MAAKVEKTGPSAQIPLEGSCDCGYVRFATDCVPHQVSNCHCEHCRRGTKLPYIAWAWFHTGEVHLMEGSAAPEAERSDLAIRESCKRCGMNLFMKTHRSPDTVSVVVQSMREPSLQEFLPDPIEHIFVADKASWWEFPPEDNLPKWPQFNPKFVDIQKKWEASGKKQRDDLFSNE